MLHSVSVKQGVGTGVCQVYSFLLCFVVPLVDGKGEMVAWPSSVDLSMWFD